MLPYCPVSSVMFRRLLRGLINRTARAEGEDLHASHHSIADAAKNPLPGNNVNALLRKFPAILFA